MTVKVVESAMGANCKCIHVSPCWREGRASAMAPPSLLLLLIVCTVAVLPLIAGSVGFSGSPIYDSVVEKVPNAFISLKPLLGHVKRFGSTQNLHLFLAETQLYNDLVLGPWMPSGLRERIPHVVQTWLRNYVAGVTVYFLSSGLWCLYVYRWKWHVFFPAGGIPGTGPIMLQIRVSMQAMPFYIVLPTVSEYMVEQGWTRCYSRVDAVGWPTYLGFVATYLALVEFGIYWMHRGLHDIKPLYKHLHATHHIYNKQDTLSPFAGLAFHPVDGILQAAPHVLVLFVVPMHFFTHELLLFLEGVWSTNIHDCIDGRVWGVMGAGFHAIHHTTYRHNYGHYTVFMDWIFGTLREPCDVKAKQLKSV